MKIQNRIQGTVAAKLILGVLITTFAFAVAANAQPAFSGSFVLPQGVHWNRAVLPAGEYFIEMSSINGPAVVHLKNSDVSFYIGPPALDYGAKGATQLNITVQGNERTVRSLNLPRINRTLIFQPLTKAEKEMLAKSGQKETVAVMAARK